MKAMISIHNNEFEPTELYAMETIIGGKFEGVHIQFDSFEALSEMMFAVSEICNHLGVSEFQVEVSQEMPSRNWCGEIFEMIN